MAMEFLQLPLLLKKRCNTNMMFISWDERMRYVNASSLFLVNVLSKTRQSP